MSGRGENVPVPLGLKVFPDNDEFGYVSRKVLEILGLMDAAESNEREVEDAKN